MQPAGHVFVIPGVKRFKALYECVRARVRRVCMCLYIPPSLRLGP